MCQSKSLGGKRCAIHHHGTQAAVQSTSVKTGIASEEVKDVFRSLNKEGKKLPAPSEAEYNSYLEKERFMTEVDPTLPARDKNMILKKLKKAKTENLPSGGTFHAWKHLMSSTMQRIGKKTRLVVAGFTVAAVAFGAAGCAPTGSANSSTAATGGTSISQVEGETVTDALGTYSHISVNPNDAIFAFPQSSQTIVDTASLSANGFTEADAAAASKAAASFVVTEMIDNASIDTPDTFASTLQADGEKYFTGDYVSIMTDPSQSTIIYTAPAGVTFARDGKPRISSSKIDILTVAGSTLNDGRKTITVAGRSQIDYRLSEASKKTMNKDKITGIGSWDLRMISDGQGGWKIAGYQTSFETIK